MKKVLLLILASLGMSSAIAVSDDNQAIIDRIKPYGSVHVAGASAQAAGAARSGEEVYNGTCIGCHSSGMLSAPKTFSKADWQPRFDARGYDTVWANAINGYNAMPPKGACGDCSDDEIKAAIDFMIAYK